MSVCFKNVKKIDPDFECPICFEEATDEDVVVDHVGGEQHPYHKICVRNWVSDKPSCPHCRKPVDRTSLGLLSKTAARAMDAAKLVLILGVTAYVIKRKISDTGRVLELHEWGVYGVCASLMSPTAYLVRNIFTRLQNEFHETWRSQLGGSFLGMMGTLAACAIFELSVDSLSSDFFKYIPSMRG